MFVSIKKWQAPPVSYKRLQAGEPAPSVSYGCWTGTAVSYGCRRRLFRTGAHVSRTIKLPRRRQFRTGVRGREWCFVQLPGGGRWLEGQHSPPLSSFVKFSRQPRACLVRSGARGRGWLVTTDPTPLGGSVCFVRAPPETLTTVVRGGAGASVSYGRPRAECLFRTGSGAERLFRTGSPIPGHTVLGLIFPRGGHRARLFRTGARDLECWSLPQTTHLLGGELVRQLPSSPPLRHEFR